VKYRSKAFTLIELLVVVAIIGILSAIGVVSYNSYTSFSKKEAAKAQHKMIVNIVQTELLKCSMGQKLILKKMTSGIVVDQPDLCPSISTGIITYDTLMVFSDHFKVLNFKNTYFPQWNAVAVCTVSRDTVSHNHGDGGGSCIDSRENYEIIVGTNIAKYETLIVKIKIN